MKETIKFSLNLVSLTLTLPFIILCKLEEWLLPKGTELIFNSCAQAMSILPGIPGMYLRRAFYKGTLEQSSLGCHIGFGTIVSHRATIIEDRVYIGSYSLIGSAHLKEHCLIGSRASILSGRALHVLAENGLWTPYSASRLAMITIERNVWIGEGAIIIADIGEGCMVGAGSVVTTTLKPNITVTGNPARFVKRVDSQAD